MESTVDKLEALVKQAEIKLDATSVDLEVELSKETGMQLNPLKLVHTVRDLKNELEELSEKAESQKKNYEEKRLLFENRLNTVCKNLQDLEDRTGASENNSKAVSGLDF